MLRNRLVSLTLVPLLAACGDDPAAPGTITATVYGEEFIEDGIPADELEDGWAIAFDRFLVSIGQPAAKAGEGSEEVGDPGLYIVDLAQPSGGDGYALATFAAPAGRYDHYGYRIAPSTNASVVNAAAADASLMKAASYSIWVTGTATRGAESRTFDWGFAMKLAYAHCEMDVAIAGDDVVMQATIHADHLFYDDAVSPEPALAFQLIADADGADGSTPDGAITLEELAATDIRGEARYQVGSQTDLQGNAITNLRQYLELQVTTVGHINGEGHCEDLIATP
jgi:hypothetical protein